MARFENLLARIAVAAAAIPIILFLTLKGGYYFFVLITVLSSFTLYEFYGLAEKKGVFPLKIFGLCAGVLLNIVFIYERLLTDSFELFASKGVRISVFAGHQLIVIVLLFLLLGTMLTELFRKRGSPLLNASVTAFGVMAVSLSFGTLISMRELFPYGFPLHKFFAAGFIDDSQLVLVDRWGGLTVIALFASIWMCDTMAYFGGKTFGRNLLFERISPKKTWEGTIAGFFSSVATMVLAKYCFLGYLALHHALVLGVLVGVFGQLGDLIESRFKRDANVKDSSALLPGHGGMYDRFDSLVFLSPIVYLYIEFIVLS
jgi:phosphatidate cytidylyltransferase